MRLNGVRGVLLTILKSGTASTLSVVEGIKAAMPRILSGLPPELESREFADQSLFVRAAIKGVVTEGVIAAALTALMMLLFLGAWRSTLIIATSIPLSVLASLAALLVDEATVTIENIHTHLARGKPTVQAILDASQEIALPAFVSALCISIVFVPLAEAVIFAVLASWILSRTLVPTMAMWFYRHTQTSGQAAEAGEVAAWLRPFVVLGRRFDNGFARFREGYRRWLGAWLGAALQHWRVFTALFVGFCDAAVRRPSSTTTT